MKKLCSAIISILLVLSVSHAGRASKGLQVLSTRLEASQRSASIKFAPRQIRESNRRLRQTIKARYPQAVGAARDPRLAKLNQELRKFIDKEVKKFRIEGQPPEERTFTSGSTFDSSYSVRHAANGLVSIAFLIEAYYEGAIHGLSKTIVFNYDLESGRMLRLADLFRQNSNYLKPISDYAIKSLRKELTPDPEFDWLKSGAGPEEENYKSWNLSRKGLEVNFDPYQVASYAEGPHEVVIPYSVLKDVIDPAGPLAKIVSGAYKTPRIGALSIPSIEKPKTDSEPTKSNKLPPRPPVSEGIGVGYGEVNGMGIGPGRGLGTGVSDRNTSREAGRSSNGAFDPNKIFSSKEVEVKARLLSKPEPQMTEEAKRNDVNGTVMLRVVLSATGQVTNIVVVSGLPYGLSEKAVEAARRIKFAPAMKNGRPVSQYIHIEYNFNSY